MQTVRQDWGKYLSTLLESSDLFQFLVVAHKHLVSLEEEDFFQLPPGQLVTFMQLSLFQFP